MISCPNCSKENQDHYKFCLGCGAKLPQPAAPAAPHAAAPQVPSGPSQPVAPLNGADPTVPPLPGSPPVPAAPQPAATGTCPSCNMVNPPGFAFCGRCGQALGTALPDAAVAFPTAPSPPRVGAPSAPSPPQVGVPPPTAAPQLGVPPPPAAPQLGVPPPAAAPQVSVPHPAAPPQAGTPAPTGDMGSAETMFMDGGPQPHAPPAQAAFAVRLVMLGQDGNPVGERVLDGESLEVGRNAGPPWDDDAYLDPKHAALTPVKDGVQIEDFGSLNGVYLKLKARTELRDGDQFRVGQELLYYEDLPEPTQAADGSERMGSPNPGYWGRLSVLVDPKVAVRALPIAGSGITIGREMGDMTFPSDGYVSGSHCRIIGDDSGVYLEDVGSSNGTYIRVRSGDTVPFGSLVLIGQKLFQVKEP